MKRMLILSFALLGLLGCTWRTATTTETTVSTPYGTGYTTPAPTGETTLYTPTGLSLSQAKILTWHAVENATGYVVLINDTEYPVTDASFSMDAFPLNAFYDIWVKARGTEGESLYSALLIYQPFTELDIEKHVRFSINSVSPIRIELPDPSASVLRIKVGVPVTDMVTYLEAGTAFVPTEGAFSFPSAFFASGITGDHVFTVFTTVGLFLVTVTVTDSTTPYLVDDPTVVCRGEEDVRLTFELFGGTLDALAGNDIDGSDYVIEGNTVTIDYDYILGKFNSDPERTTLILSCMMTKDADLFFEYLFIEKPLG
jgi:hypothetical protein